LPAAVDALRGIAPIAASMPSSSASASADTRYLDIDGNHVADAPELA